MGGKSKSPDYGQAAYNQGEANKEVNTAQTFANRPNQYTPAGSSTWTPYQTIDPATGDSVTAWNNYLEMSPEQRAIYDKQQEIAKQRADVGGMVAGRLANEYGTAADFSGFSEMGANPNARYTMPQGGFSNLRQHGEDMRFQKSQSRLSPQFAEKRRAMEVQLRNQGLSPEDSAWKSQMAGIDTAETDAYAQAQYDAATGGMGEAQQMFSQMLGANAQNYGMDMSSANYANLIRQQQIAELMQQRGFSLNELNAIMSGQQVGMPSMPSFSQASRAESAPIYQGAVDQGNFNQGSNQQNIDAITGLAGGAMALSDRRLKRNIRPMGTVNGHKWYSFDYIWGQSSQGVMADEVPESYTIDIGGFKAVDYSKVLGV